MVQGMDTSDQDEQGRGERAKARRVAGEAGEKREAGLTVDWVHL